MFVAKHCSQLTARSCLCAAAELQGCISWRCPSYMQGALSSSTSALPAAARACGHTHCAGNKLFFSSLILAGSIFQPLQLLLFAATFVFLPSIQKRKKILRLMQRKFTLLIWSPLAILSQSSAWKKESCFVTTELSYFRKDKNIPIHLCQRVAKVSKTGKQSSCTVCPHSVSVLLK